MTIPIIIPKVFTKKQCESIISFHSDGWDEKIGTYGNKKIDSSFRQCMVYTPPELKDIPKWIKEAIADAVVYVNKETYNFDLGKGEVQLNLLRYDLGGHYRTHIDIGRLEPALRRKISFTLLLNDSYEGGKLTFNIIPEMSQRNSEIGDMIIFPSYLEHKVEPITSGVRWSLVGWILGEKHFI